MSKAVLIPKRGWPLPDFWLDASRADTYSLDTDRLTSWQCKFTAAYDFTAAGDVRPTYAATGINSLPAFYFDGVDDYVAYAGTPMTAVSGQGSTVIIACRSDTNANVATLYAQQDKDVDNRCIRLQRRNTPFEARFSMANTSAAAYNGSTPLAANTAVVVTYIINTSNQPKIWVGTNEDTMSSSTAAYGWGSVTGADSAVVGCRAYDSGSGVTYDQPWKGYIAQVMGWNYVLTSSHLAAVQAWLNGLYVS